ncbi:TetR/AcrR family transcriptional regulator [Kutzneria kofuensis]|uniref:AcrR family transcriptional regulator n=1 Tax=Kutzneria kofuensis TaxID=103725 RepID=A0A7W9NKV5_9PSEU|nr:TetR/AcrR family transcriptional regulator [Kutzneria kofuensis]MBB5897037.1 AcrR family transcriptional regulator [Kutzneria kofuensis]
MSSTADTTRSRRRGAELEHALYEATLDELAEVGYGRLTMEGVAARARTGKAAVYRRWSTRQALVLDALRHALPALPGFDPQIPARENLRAVFTVLCQLLAGETSFPGLPVIAGLLGDPVLRQAFVEAIVRPRLLVIESILGHAEETGEIEPGTLTPMAVQTGPALIMQACLLTGNPPTPQDIDRIVDSVLPVGRRDPLRTR